MADVVEVEEAIEMLSIGNASLSDIAAKMTTDVVEAEEAIE